MAAPDGSLSHGSADTTSTFTTPISPEPSTAPSRYTSSPLTTHLLTPHQLSVPPYSSLLTPLASMINTSFSKHHSCIIPSHVKRLSTPEQLLTGLHETGFMFVTLEDTAREGEAGKEGEEDGEGGKNLGRVIAVAGCKPWDPENVIGAEREDGGMGGNKEEGNGNGNGNGGDKENMGVEKPAGKTSVSDEVARKVVEDVDPTRAHTSSTTSAENNEVRGVQMGERTDEWEVTLVAVEQNPPYQKSGLALRLYALIDSEVRRIRDESGRHGKPIRMVIRTAKEVNGEYWARRGYEFVTEMRVPKGTWEAVRDFHLVTMDKWLD
ncbi:MAG: hypothetical protein M1827_006675 [Pycnora praestabilis]|nr:MAG: hypothetical protein M1827_006675 [Pycnora praestabilis]